MLLEQIMRRQAEYTRSLPPRSSVALAENLDVAQPSPRIRKVKPKLLSATTEPLEIVQELPPLVEEPIDEELRALGLLDSGVFKLDEEPPAKKEFDLVSIFEKYVPKTKGKIVGAKTMGLPVPEELHARMTKFLADHKDKPGSPQSLKDLGLMCLGLAMDSIDAPHGDTESSL